MDPFEHKQFIPQVAQNEIEGKNEENEEDSNGPNELKIPPDLNQINPQPSDALNSHLEVKNINNMNINIINQYQTHPNQEDLISNFARLNLREKTDSAPKKIPKTNNGLAFNYFFGEDSGQNEEINQMENPQNYLMNKGYYIPKSQETKGNLNLEELKDYGKTEFGKTDFTKTEMQEYIPYSQMEDQKYLNMNYSQGQPIQSQTGNYQFNMNPNMNPNMNEDADSQLYKLNYAKSGNIPGKFFVIKSIDESNVMRVRLK